MYPSTEWLQSVVPGEESDANLQNPLAPSEARSMQEGHPDLLENNWEQDALDDSFKLSLSITDDSDNETIPDARAEFDSSGNLQQVGSQPDFRSMLDSPETNPPLAVPRASPLRTQGVQGEQEPFQRHIFTHAPGHKRQREVWKPPLQGAQIPSNTSPGSTNAGQCGDLMTACVGFIETLGNLPSTLPCCGYSLENVQLAGDATQRQQCPNPECRAEVLPNGHSFGLHWDTITAIAKLRISCSTPAPATPPMSSRSASEYLMRETPGLHSPHSSHPASVTQSVPLSPASDAPFMHTQHASSFRERMTPPLESIYQEPAQFAGQMDASCYSAPVSGHSRQRPKSGSFLAPHTPRYPRRTSHYGSTASTLPYSGQKFSSHLSKDLPAATKCLTAPVSRPLSHDTGLSACSQQLSDGQHTSPLGNGHTFQPVYQPVARQEHMFPGAPPCDSAPVYIPPDTVDIFAPGPFPQYRGFSCNPDGPQVGCEWTPRTATSAPVPRGQRTGEHHLDPNAMAHTESTAGQDNEAGTLVPWQKLSAELVAGAWDVWPTSCIPGLNDFGQRLQVYFAGRKHPSIDGVVQLQQNTLLYAHVGNRLVGLHLKFANVAARWCLPFDKPKAKEGSTQRRLFSKATINFTVSVHVSAVGGCAGMHAMGTAPHRMPHKCTLTLQVYVLRHGVEHKKVQLEERLPETILNHIMSPQSDNSIFKHSLKGATRRDVTIHLNPATQGPVEVEFRGLDFEDSNNQEKVYLFVVGILHSAGLPGNRVPYEVENNIMATQLLVPTICVSKRRRGPVDYIEQAVSSLGYDWKSVSAAKLY